MTHGPNCTGAVSPPQDQHLHLTSEVIQRLPGYAVGAVAFCDLATCTSGLGPSMFAIVIGRKYSKISTAAAWAVTVRASTRLRQIPKKPSETMATSRPRNVFTRARLMPPAKSSGL